MTETLVTAAARLAAVLARENDALAALDLPAAAGLVAEKRAATEALERSQAGMPAVARDPGLAAAAERLRALAEENRRLLERAIAVQGRVIGIIARAASQAVALPGYGAGGDRTRPRQGPAMALSARA
jgi:hypothetical protein